MPARVERAFRSPAARSLGCNFAVICLIPYVNHVDVAKLLHGKESVGVTVGIDVGKHRLFAVCRWDDGTFARPWRIHNPSALPDLVKLLQYVGGDHKLVVAMESSGTYGDALRQALA